jgi:hypothetical protein
LVSRPILAVSALLALSGIGSAAAKPLVRTVGCASDGQMGPVVAPEVITGVPTVSGKAAGRLAYYAMGDLGVLAPLGWHCFGLYGSNGAQLIVTPERHDAHDLLEGTEGLTGPAVQIVALSGETSGRFEVAKAVSRLFPAYRTFVDRVVSEGIEPRSDFPAAPYPADRLEHKSDREAEFLTPANADGIGTQSRLVKSDTPIVGFVQLSPDRGMDLTEIFVRMPPELVGLATPIVVAAERGVH